MVQWDMHMFVPGCRKTMHSLQMLRPELQRWTLEDSAWAVSERLHEDKCGTLHMLLTIDSTSVNTAEAVLTTPAV